MTINSATGRYVELHGGAETQKLEYGMDFRQPQYRREVFLRFYGFHLKYFAHPGAVYYLFPYLREYLDWDLEDCLWVAFLNGCTQNPVTTLILLERFPTVEDAKPDRIKGFFDDNWKRIDYDMDRRYVKAHLGSMVEDYKCHLAGGTQAQFFGSLCSSDDPHMNFRTTWDYVFNKFSRYGRLSTFSYLEYLRIMGLNLDCDNLFLRDLSGSKSHRNGLCKVLGRDDLDWHDSNPAFKGYTDNVLGWIEAEAVNLFSAARNRYNDPLHPYAQDVSYFTLESALCTYKSWHRPNRRYPNVYNDMLCNRIRRAEKAWDRPFDILWDARKAVLPDYLRLEDNPRDPGVNPIKQNHYLHTGQPVMMDKEWPCFKNEFNDCFYG